MNEEMSSIKNYSESSDLDSHFRPDMVSEHLDMEF